MEILRCMERTALCVYKIDYTLICEEHIRSVSSPLRLHGLSIVKTLTNVRLAITLDLSMVRPFEACISGIVIHLGSYVMSCLIWGKYMLLLMPPTRYKDAHKFHFYSIDSLGTKLFFTE